MDNLLYVAVPFFVGLGLRGLFVPCISALCVARLGVLLRRRRSLSAGEFARELANKALWLCFNCVYVLYWALELAQVDCPASALCTEALRICDIAETFIFLLGCLIEVGLSIIIIL